MPGKRRLAFKLAWQMTKDELVGSNPRLVAAAVLTGLTSYGSYRVMGALGRDFPGDELVPAFVGPVGFIFVFVVLLIFNFVFRAPYKMLDIQDDRLDALERRLRPSFSVPSPHERQYERVPYGSAMVTAGGQRFTNASSANDIFDIPIINRTATTLRGCEAYLSKFEEVGSGEPRIWEAIRLSWLPVQERHETVDIPSEGKRSLCLFRVISNHVHLVTDEVPLRMVRMIEPKGVYEGLIVLTAHDTAATHISFRLTCNAPENPPTLSVGEIGK